MTLAWIILGGLVPLTVAYSLGKLCFPQAPDAIALGTGAAIESLIVLALLAVGIARPPAFVALGVIGLLPLAWRRPRPQAPVPRGLLGLVFAIYGVLYLRITSVWCPNTRAWAAFPIGSGSSKCCRREWRCSSCLHSRRVSIPQPS